MRIRMLLSFCCAAAVVSLATTVPVHAQFKEGGEEKGTKLGPSQTTYWRRGMILRAGGPCGGANGYVPVPAEWPEQEVRIVREEKSPEVKIHYETIEGGVRIMRFTIAHLAAGQEAKALVTMEIRRRSILPPDNTDIYVLPDVKKLKREIRRYLAPSLGIESRDPKIRALAKEIGADKTKAWERVEAIYDWVRAKIKYETGAFKGAKAALKDGTGDCEELSSLFIAICRAADIPARTVWVDGHCYSEFYLFDNKDEGHWFPCQSAGSREFGGITESRPILQKGDNFQPPQVKEHKRYVAEFLAVKAKKSSPPQPQWVAEAVAK